MEDPMSEKDHDVIHDALADKISEAMHELPISCCIDVLTEMLSSLISMAETDPLDLGLQVAEELALQIIDHIEYSQCENTKPVVCAGQN